MIFQKRFWLVILGVLFSFCGQAQDSISFPRSLYVKVDLLRTVPGFVAYEKFIGGTVAIELGVKKRKSFQLLLTRLKRPRRYGLNNNVLAELSQTEVTVVYKYYLSKKAKSSGFFVAPYISSKYYFYNTFVNSYDGTYAKVKSLFIGGGCMLGYQLRHNRLVLELIIGAGAREPVHIKEDVHLAVYQSDYDYRDLKRTMIDYQGALCIGYNISKQTH